MAQLKEETEAKENELAELKATLSGKEKTLTEKEKLLAEKDATIAEKDILLAKQATDGKADAGQLPPKPKEETPKEYKDKIMKGEV